ncbi:MAG: hypothetical protein IKE68_08440 [Solobacterium sp.]|nr:hypothetical protein [Solobacterium sp.]
MNKILKAAMAALLVCGMTACTKKEEPAPEPTEETAAEAAEETAEAEVLEETKETVGAWEVFADAYAKNMTDDDKNHFDAALEGLTGVGYTPIAVLARQVVSGENTAYLALGTTVTADPVTDFYIAVVYTNLQGESEITSIKKIDMNDVRLAEQKPAGELLGGWTAEGYGRPGCMSAEGESAMSMALAGFTGTYMMPVAQLGQQVVSGMNFRYLLSGGDMTESEPEPAVVYFGEVYMDTEGKAELTTLQPLDLLYYVTPEEE